VKNNTKLNTDKIKNRNNTLVIEKGNMKKINGLKEWGKMRKRK
jgi:hypothetical protein